MTKSNGPLYAMGGAHARAIGRDERHPQQIHTPESVLDVCRFVWGEIALDPCASPARTSFATDSYYEDQNGLTLPWRDCTFANPPFRDLKLWLAKSEMEKVEQILLFPVRSNRKWWVSYAKQTTALAWLAPLKFEGYDLAFPAPLCLAYLGQHTEKFIQGVERSRISHGVTTGGL